MPDIFLTYSKRDQDLVNRFQPVLKRLSLELGAEYFQDLDSLRPGELWEDRLAEALETCSVALAFLSENYFSSTFIQRNELRIIEARIDRGLLLVPVFVRPVLVPEDSVFFHVQYVNTPDRPLCDMTSKELSAFAVEFEKVLRNLLEGFPKTSRPSEIRYNIAVVGKTGAGKSELINYLFGRQLVKTGIGLPVTQLGFHRRDSVIAEIPTSIWDSAGLEVGRHDQWLATLKDELESRGPSEPIQRWFHTVLYCVQVVGSRIDPFEIQIINDFIRHRYKVVVVLTKAYVGEGDTRALASAIQEHISIPISCIAVNSKRQLILTTEVAPFGRVQLIREIEVSLIDSLTERIPARCIAFTETYIDKECRDLIAEVERALGVRRKNDISDSVAKKLEEIVKDIKSPVGRFHQIIWRETRNTLSIYRQIAGIAEQAMAAAEAEGVVEEISDPIPMPRTKKYWRRFGDLFDDYLDWDVSDKVEEFVGSIGDSKFVAQAADVIGEVADGLAKTLVAPFAALGSALEGLVAFVGDHRSYKSRIEARINACSEQVKADLWKNEESIKRTFLEHVRRV